MDGWILSTGFNRTKPCLNMINVQASWPTNDECFYKCRILTVLCSVTLKQPAGNECWNKFRFKGSTVLLLRNGTKSFPPHQCLFLLLRIFKSLGLQVSTAGFIARFNVKCMLVCVCLVQDRVQVNNGVLTISSLNLADIGMYQCVAENKHGRIFTNAELRVVGKGHTFL